MTTSNLEKLGQLADKADNFAHAGNIPMPAEIHKGCLIDGMKDIRSALREIYIAESGENPWEEL